MKDKLDVKYTLEDSNGNKYTILDTQRVDLQEELNKEIEKQAKEIERLKEEYIMLQNASDEVEEEKDKEIERLKEQLNDEIDDELKQSEIMVKQQNEIERQKEIIRQLDIKNLELTTTLREVREYIKDIQNTMWHDDKEVLKTILEILDKEKQ